MQGKTGSQFTTITKPAMIVGRNNTPVPPDEVELMAKIGSTDREIAEHFGINDQTLRYNFKDFLIKGRSELKQRLRQAQLRVAFEGNPTMLIWLGRNILGQNEIPHNTEENRALPWTDDDLEEIKDAIEEELNDIESESNF